MDQVVMVSEPRTGTVVGQNLAQRVSLQTCTRRTGGLQPPAELPDESRRASALVRNVDLPPESTSHGGLDHDHRIPTQQLLP